jgi:hypothetical protein
MFAVHAVAAVMSSARAGGRSILPGCNRQPLAVPALQAGLGLPALEVSEPSLRTPLRQLLENDQHNKLFICDQWQEPGGGNMTMMMEVVSMVI